MHRPSEAEAAHSREKKGECAHTARRDRTLLLQVRRYPEARDLRWIKYECCSNCTITCYRDVFLNVRQHSIRAALNSMRDGPMGHGFGCGDGSCVDWHQRHVVRVFLLSVFWLSSLRGVRSCGSLHGLGCRLGLPGLFVLVCRF